MIKNNWHVWGFKAFVIGTLLSCSSSSSFRNDDYGLDLNSCSADTQKEFVHRAMQDRYYWYQTVPDSVDYSAFNSPEDVLLSLRYQPYDRYSYVALASGFNSYYDEGQYVGYGFGYSRDTALLRFVYNDSPFGRAGFKRGDKLISIDGALTSGFDEDAWDNAFGEAQVGVSKTFVIEHQDLSQTSVTLAKAVVTINTVLAAESFTDNGKQYAYLAFKNFINPSYDELETAFAQFKADGAEKLILDLRYNGGGSIAVAAALASYIHQPQNGAEIFTRLKFNAKYSGENYSFLYQERANSLNLNEVIVLTSESTCSASEMVINGLKPFVNVSVIGSTTCGKPIGMRAQNFCDKKLVAINFQGFNSEGFGDYFDGITADCGAEDDENFAFGDVNEPMLKAALDYDNNALCAAPRASKNKMFGIPSLYQGLQSEYQSE